MKQKELLILSIVVFLTIVSWLIIDIYHISKNNDDVLKTKFSAPVDVKVNINSKVFEILNKKE